MMSECSKAQNLFSERIFAELLSDFHAFFFFGGWGLPRPQRQCLPFFMKVSDFFFITYFCSLPFFCLWWQNGSNSCRLSQTSWKIFARQPLTVELIVESAYGLEPSSL